MSKELILRMSMSVDGFVAGPNGEFDWAFPSMSDAGRQWTAELLGTASIHAMGRKAYQQMAPFWPTAPGPLGPVMNEIPKAVFSRSGVITPPSYENATNADPAAVESWRNPILAGKDLVADIQRMKAEDGGPIIVHGGAEFASSLIAANLIDLYYLVVHPVAIGRGMTIFGGLESPRHLKLEDTRKTDTGVVVKIYRPA